MLLTLVLVASCGLPPRGVRSLTTWAALPSSLQTKLRVEPLAASSSTNHDSEDDDKSTHRRHHRSARAQSARLSNDDDDDNKNVVKGRPTARRLSANRGSHEPKGAASRRRGDEDEPRRSSLPPRDRARVSKADDAEKTADVPKEDKKERCGYCGERFETRIELFRHLRENNSCHELALTQTAPLPARKPPARLATINFEPAPPQPKSPAADSAAIPKAQRCGYCGMRFETRSKLFRHLREDNSCRKLAISHGMPLENPYKTKDRRLRRVYGDILLAGCIVLHRKPGEPIQSPIAMAFKTGGLYADDPIFQQYEVVLVRNAGGRQGFPKGKIELTDPSLLAAALRETWEEAGLRAAQLHVLPAWAAADVRKRFDGEDTEWAAQDDSADDDVYGLGDDDDGDDDYADDIESDDDEEEDDLADDDDDEDLADAQRVSVEQQRLSQKAASIDVREITGRFGKRARYFVCAVIDPSVEASAWTKETSPVLIAPKSTKDVNLTSKNDADRDIEEVKWLHAHDAMKELGSKRRTALRRALAIHEIYFESQYRDASGERPPRPVGSRRASEH